MNDIKNIRKDYKKFNLDIDHLAELPLQQFRTWLDEAIESECDEPTAMHLSTVGINGRPSSRIVLLKGVDEKGLLFFTNYFSRKGTELANNPFASLTFFWPLLERQIRIEGKTEKISQNESEAYFNSRPFESKLSAVVSPQSTVIQTREMLEEKKDMLRKEYQHRKGALKKPEFWGGYRLIPDYFEFWQGRESRLHDRLVYELSDKNWKIFRIAP